MYPEGDVQDKEQPKSNLKIKLPTFNGMPIKCNFLIKTTILYASYTL